MNKENRGLHLENVKVEGSYINENINKSKEWKKVESTNEKIESESKSIYELYRKLFSSKNNYDYLVKSGMFFELFPELSGDFNSDYLKYNPNGVVYVHGEEVTGIYYQGHKYTLTFGPFENVYVYSDNPSAPENCLVIKKDEGKNPFVLFSITLNEDEFENGSFMRFYSKLKRK